MTTYTVQAPDGHTVTLEGPPGATHDQIIAQAQQLYKPGGAGQQPAQPAQPQQPTNNDGAIAGEPDLGSVGNAALAGGLHFVHQLPFVGDAAITAARVAHAALNGQSESWGQANDEAHQILDSAQQQHPITSTIGGIAGGLDTAIVGGEAAKGMGFAPAALRLQPATTLAGHAANIARLGVTGGLAGAAQGAAQQGGEQAAAGNFQNVPQAAAQGGATGAVAGAVLGPVVGVGTAQIARVTAPLAAKTAQALAKVFGEDPADLQAAWSTFRANTGRAPTMPELATLKQQGQIAGAAKDSGPITIALRTAADDAARARSSNMQQFAANAPGQPGQGVQPATAAAPVVESSGQAQNATTAQGDVDYAASRAAPDFNVSPDESPELGGVSPADHLAGEILPQAGLGRADRVRILNGLQNGTLSSQDAQLVRSGLSESLNRNYSPAVKGSLTDLDGILSAPGNEAPNAALSTARANYATNAQRAAGAAHGESILGAATADNFAAEAAAKPNANPNFQTGLASGARSRLADQASAPTAATGLARQLATDDSLHQKLATTFGQDTADAFRRLGQSETAAADSLGPYASRTAPSDDQDASDVKSVLTAVAAMHSPIGGFVYKGVQLAKMGLGVGMSPAVQETVARYLSDPKMVPAGVNLLRRAGADNAQLRQLALQAAASGGILGANAASNLTAPSNGVTIEDIHPTTAAEIAAATAPQ